MNPFSYHRQRLRIAASLLVALAGLAGTTRAADFDEKLKAPLMKDAGTLRAQAQSFTARFAGLQAAGPQQLITDRALAAQQFDLAWQIQQAIDVRRPLGDLSALGLVNRGDGSYSIDFNAFPQWEPVDQKLANLLPRLNWDALAQQLRDRGMADAEVAKLKAYVDTHDVSLAIREQTLPVSLSFSRLVRKIDQLKRPVPEATVLSYLYQRARVATEARREWAAALLGTIDAHGARILLSTISEGTSNSIWAPSDQTAGIADILATVRRPDFEQRARAEASGEAP